MPLQNILHTRYLLVSLCIAGFFVLMSIATGLLFFRGLSNTSTEEYVAKYGSKLASISVSESFGGNYYTWEIYKDAIVGYMQTANNRHVGSVSVQKLTPGQYNLLVASLEQKYPSDQLYECLNPNAVPAKAPGRIVIEDIGGCFHSGSLSLGIGKCYASVSECNQKTQNGTFRAFMRAFDRIRGITIDQQIGANFRYAEYMPAGPGIIQDIFGYIPFIGAIIFFLYTIISGIGLLVHNKRKITTDPVGMPTTPVPAWKKHFHVGIILTLGFGLGAAVLVVFFST